MNFFNVFFVFMGYTNTLQFETVLGIKGKHRLEAHSTRCAAVHSRCASTPLKGPQSDKLQKVRLLQWTSKDPIIRIFSILPNLTKIGEFFAFISVQWYKFFKIIHKFSFCIFRVFPHFSENLVKWIICLYFTLWPVLISRKMSYFQFWNNFSLSNYIFSIWIYEQ